MNFLNLAFLAPFIMAWNSIKQFFARCGSIFVVNGELRDHLADHMHAMLWDEWKVIPLGSRRHSVMWLPLKDYNGEHGPVVAANYQGAVLFRKGLQVVSWEPKGPQCGRLLCVRGLVNYDELVEAAARRLYDQTDGHAQQRRGVGPGFYLIHFQGENVSAGRGQARSNSGAQVGEVSAAQVEHPSPEAGVCLDYFGSAARPTHEIYPLVARSKDEIGCTTAMPPLVRHYVDPAMRVLLREAQTWLSGMQWMRDRGIPHRRGILLQGPPGTGKSSFVKAMAEHFQLRLVIVELATCSDYDLPQLRDMSRSPSIFLFEDIDRIFKGDVNVTEREADKVTFDAFLNLLSGADALQGLIVLTANNPERLDPTLTRPGRVDRIVTVPLLNREGRAAVAHRIMDGCPDGVIYQILNTAEDQPAAQFENTCIQAAMEWYWKHNLSDERNQTDTDP